MARRHIQQMSGEELSLFVSENLAGMAEDEAIAVLEHRHCTRKICGAIAQNQHLAAYHSVRVRLVAHRQTPLAHAVKLVHYLFWLDLIRLSVEVTVPAQVRRSIDTVLLTRVDKLALGERVSSARRCSAALIKVFLFDRDPKVFAALLNNQRLREEDLLLLTSSTRASVEQLRMIAADRRWSFRYAVRKALVLNSQTPRSTAASQLRYLSRRDLREIYDNPVTSVYLRRCIERLEPSEGGIVVSSRA